MQIKTEAAKISTNTSSGFFQKEISLGKAFSDKTKVSFYSELKTLVKSGIDLRRSLEILEKGLKKKKEKTIVQSILDQVIKGKSLSAALQNSSYFSPYEYHSIQIGEETGKLNLVLGELEKYYSQKLKLKRQMMSALSYPIFILFVTSGVIYFMLTSVVPMFSDVFKQFGGELPPLTQKIVMLSNNAGWIFGSFALIVFAIVLISINQKNETWYRKTVSKLILKIPVFGKLTQKIYLSRFSQSLSLLTSAHTPLVQALGLVKNMISFYPMEVALVEMQEEVTKGKLFSESMSKHKIFPDKMVSLLTAAEEINDLDNMFKRLAEQYEEELDHQSKILGKILDPIMMLIIGGIVALIMIAMYLPMFSMSQVIGE